MTKPVRYNDEGHAHYLTFTSHRRLPLFKYPDPCYLFLENLSDQRDRHHFQVWAWVLMPEHVHLLIWPQNHSISFLLRQIKGGFSYRAVRGSKPFPNEVLNRFQIWTGTVASHQFWLPGGGYDRNIFSSEEMREKMVYIHNNPVRRVLTADSTGYTWSSARFWESDDRSLFVCDIPEWW